MKKVDYECECGEELLDGCSLSMTRICEMRALASTLLPFNAVVGYVG